MSQSQHEMAFVMASMHAHTTATIIALSKSMRTPSIGALGIHRIHLSGLSGLVRAARGRSPSRASRTRLIDASTNHDYCEGHQQDAVHRQRDVDAEPHCHADAEHAEPR